MELWPCCGLLVHLHVTGMLTTLSSRHAALSWRSLCVLIALVINFVSGHTVAVPNGAQQYPCRCCSRLE